MLLSLLVSARRYFAFMSHCARFQVQSAACCFQSHVLCRPPVLCLTDCAAFLGHGHAHGDPEAPTTARPTWLTAAGFLSMVAGYCAQGVIGAFVPAGSATLSVSATRRRLGRAARARHACCKQTESYLPVFKCCFVPGVVQSAKFDVLCAI